jgi:uncharacterized protein
MGGAKHEHRTARPPRSSRYAQDDNLVGLKLRPLPDTPRLRVDVAIGFSSITNYTAPSPMKIRHFVIAVAFVTVVVILHDLSVPTGRGFAARTAIAVIDGYRASVSPRLEGVVTCRFEPTCSAYGRAVLEKYGFARGSLKTAGRIARCGPWTPPGTVDPP